MDRSIKISTRPIGFSDHREPPETGRGPISVIEAGLLRLLTQAQLGGAFVQSCLEGVARCCLARRRERM